MCEYCEPYVEHGEEVISPLPSDDEGDYGAQLVIADGLLIVTMYPPATAKINCCPMCGRDLRGGAS